jgi:radical SAM superfamily enzyme YgiQ (UPF0313 family)
LSEFRREVRKGYDFVGISFIVPNTAKARKMAEVVREESPKTKIILGGHGVSIQGIENLISHDFICRGEGISFLRKLLGENVDRPVRHPLLHSSFNRRVMGVPLPETSGVLLTGVGCLNKCRFCCTSHFFESYIPYLSTGREIFDVCKAYEKKLGITDFGVLDENFLKNPERALELLDCIEKEGKLYTFGIFSSAETLRAIGDLDLLVRLGVQFIWIGVESKRETYEKNQGVDLHELIFELRERGISVMASSILFLEHHNPESLWEDINFAVSLLPDYLQFMQLGPMPGTALHDSYSKKGKILPDVPYEEWHGQSEIWFHHKQFTGQESRDLLKRAFLFDYERSGASLLRAIDTMLRGYRYALGHADSRVRRRTESFTLIKQMRYFLPAARLLASNNATRELAKQLAARYQAQFGSRSAKDFVASAAVMGLAIAEWAKIRYLSDVRHPNKNVMRYRWDKSDKELSVCMNPSLAPEA